MPGWPAIKPPSVVKSSAKRVFGRTPGRAEGLEETQGRHGPDRRDRPRARRGGAGRQDLQGADGVVIDEIVAGDPIAAHGPHREGQTRQIEGHEIRPRRGVLGHRLDVRDARVDVDDRIRAEGRHHEDIGSRTNRAHGTAVVAGIIRRRAGLRVPGVVVDDRGARRATRLGVATDLLGRPGHVRVRVPHRVLVQARVDDQLVQETPFSGSRDRAGAAMPPMAVEDLCIEAICADGTVPGPGCRCSGGEEEDFDVPPIPDIGSIRP